MVTYQTGHHYLIMKIFNKDSLELLVSQFQLIRTMCLVDSNLPCHVDIIMKIL